MNKVKKLPSNLIDQIAAGEVIERPASAVKELLENSIDSGATQIDITIIEGGKNLIQVVDNGCGMNKKDLELSFQRHATSKLKEEDDLTKISTLGFRGEALPSMASVSKIIAKSNVQNNGNGYEIKIFGGKIENIIPAACNYGTTVTINNLFYNTPGRKNFLKKTNTEYRKITSIIRIYLLSNPSIGFTYKSGDFQIYNVKKESLLTRIGHIFGKPISKSLIEVDYKKESYKISGFIGNLNLVKKRPSEQYLFINGRYIQDRLIKSSISKAYKSLINRGEFPFYVLNIEIPPELVDFNVHPTKLQVRFQDEWRLYHVVKTSITIALKDILSTSPSLNINYNQDEYYKNKFNSNNNELINQIPIQAAPQEIENNNNIDRVHKNFDKMFDKNQKELFFDTGNFWQIMKKYIVTEMNNGLLLIDQHVAHERILFEDAIKAINGNGLPSQTLLFPQTVRFLPDEYSQFVDITGYLEKIGFRMREFGENTIIVEGVPSDVEWGEETDILKEILGNYLDFKEHDASFIRYLAASFSCKAAIKAGDIIEKEEMSNLINRLFSTNNPYYCPHGRPIVIKLTEEELDKRFERK